MRLFVAITLPEPTKLHIAKLQRELHSPFLVGNWVRHENFHITLKFLGNVADASLESLEKLLNSFVEPRKTFSVSLSEVQVVPFLSAPEMIWLSCQSNSLTLLAYDLDQALQSLGFSPAKEQFVGHVTLARLKRGKVKPQWLEARVAQFKALDVEVKKITLYQSCLKDSGPEYKVIKHFRFGTSISIAL